MDDKSKLLDLIKRSLNKIGYDNEKIIDKYPITTKEENVIYFDFIAFGHNKIQDTSTSCISVKYCEDENEEEKVVEDATYSASPLLIVSKKLSVKLWKINADKESEFLDELEYDNLDEYFCKNRVNYDYTKIISSKYETEQLNFLNVNNLFKFVSKINCELLGKEFKNAIDSARGLINEKNKKQMADLTSIVMHLIAAKILNDKLVLKCGNMHMLLEKLSKQYGDYFDTEYLYKYNDELIDKITLSFSKNLLYRSIDNKILGNFYENTLFESDKNKNKKLKEELGIYYTPSCIVNNLMEAMPIELIDYRKRYVLDASCGSGSLLIGAYKRLKEMLPIQMREDLQHEYLTDMLYGIDVDKFACEVARLELLLNSIPYGNGWRINNKDFIKTKNIEFNPNIIIANPPYKETREGKQQEKASIFLKKYIKLLNDQGLIGIVLPQTFLSNKSSKQARKELLENIQLHEVWMLPKGIFDTNNCATVVIIGKKQKIKENKGFKGRIVVKNNTSITRFKKTGVFDFEFACKSQLDFLNNPEYKITITPMQDILDKIGTNNKLSNYIDYTRGVQIPYSKYPLVSNVYKENYYKLFRDGRFGVNKYKFDWNKQKGIKYIKYDPDNEINKEFIRKQDKGLRLRERKRYIFEDKKVVFPRNSTPGTFWRIKAAIVDGDIYPSDSFWCFIMKDKTILLEILVAILNSKIVNLYIDTVNIGLTLKSFDLLNIPFPKLTNIEKERITKCVKEIENSINIEENMNLIDNVLYEAFNLDEKDIKSIELYYSQVTSNINYNQIKDIVDTIEVTGKVTEIDLQNKIIKSSFVECEDEKLIKITNEIPGWLLAEEVSFVCSISEDDFYKDEVSIMNVRPLQYTYLNDEEYSNLLLNKFNDYNPSKKELKVDLIKEEAQ